jgi:hypothetical protein
VVENQKILEERGVVSIRIRIVGFLRGEAGWVVMGRIRQLRQTRDMARS